MKTNEQLQRDVIEELAWEPSIDAAAIGVSVHDGVVTLRGYVNSYAEKYAAEKAVKRVRGVQGLAEQLEVRLPSSTKRDDTDIATMALTALRSNVFVPIDAIRVSVEDGWLYLEGTVDWKYQKEYAAKGMRYLPGVRGVTNNIAVKSSIRPRDVLKNVRSALERSADLEADGITVKTEGDKVILIGTVRSWSEKNAAERAAWSAQGVNEVKSHLEVNAYAFT